MDSLPGEILEQILGYLPALSQIRALLVSKLFQDYLTLLLGSLQLDEEELSGDIRWLGLTFTELVSRVLRTHGAGVKKLELISRSTIYFNEDLPAGCPDLVELACRNHYRSSCFFNAEIGHIYGVSKLGSTALLKYPRLKILKARLDVAQTEIVTVLRQMRGMLTVSCLELWTEESLSVLKAELDRGGPIQSLTGMNLNQKLFRKLYQPRVVCDDASKPHLTNKPGTAGSSSEQLIFDTDYKSSEPYYDPAFQSICSTLTSLKLEGFTSEGWLDRDSAALKQLAKLTGLSLGLDVKKVPELKFLAAYADLEVLEIVSGAGMTREAITGRQLGYLSKSARLQKVILRCNYNACVFELFAERGYRLRSVDLGSGLQSGGGGGDNLIATKIADCLNRCCVGSLETIRYDDSETVNILASLSDDLIGQLRYVVILTPSRLTLVYIKTFFGRRHRLSLERKYLAPCRLVMNLVGGLRTIFSESLRIEGRKARVVINLV